MAVRRLLIATPWYLAAMALAIVAIEFGLFRLGVGRHRSSFWEFRFLHLDWVTQPDLPYWSMHVQNLSVLAMGLLGVLVSTGLLAYFLSGRWTSSRATS